MKLLRLWARMIASSLHDSTDEPPAVPAFQNVTPKRTQNTTGGAINNAAEAFVKYMDKRNIETPTTSTVMSNTVDANPSTFVGFPQVKSRHKDEKFGATQPL